MLEMVSRRASPEMSTFEPPGVQYSIIVVGVCGGLKVEQVEGVQYVLLLWWVGIFLS
jgi:hypothetical protein